MTSTLRVTASNKFTLFNLKTRQIAVRNAFWKGSFVPLSSRKMMTQRMAAESPNRPVLQGHGMATICVERALPWPNSDLIQI